MNSKVVLNFIHVGNLFENGIYKKQKQVDYFRVVKEVIVKVLENHLSITLVHRNERNVEVTKEESNEEKMDGTIKEVSTIVCQLVKRTVMITLDFRVVFLIGNIVKEAPIKREIRVVF